jgi:uncharacterized RDD family membrane protein YckC
MKHQFRSFCLTIAALGLLPAFVGLSARGQTAQEDRWHSDDPMFFTDFVLPKGDSMHDSLLIKGSTTIDGEVEHDSVTIFGDATVNGKVGNNLVVIAGSAELGPKAEVGGQVVVVGGQLKQAPGAQIHGEKAVVHIPGLKPAFDWVTKGLLLGRPLPPTLPWVWLVAGLLLLIHLLVLLMFPQPIQACVETMERKPITSFFAGILVKLLFGLFLTLLAITVVGLIVAPFLIAAGIVGFVFGKITTYRYVGQQLARPMGLDFLQRPAIALIVGTAVFYLLYMVPFVGFIAWGFSGVFGLGAVAMAAVGRLRVERREAAPPSQPPPPTFPPPGGAPPFTYDPAPAAEAGAAAVPFLTQSQPPPFAQPPGFGITAAQVSQWPRAGFWIRLGALALDFALYAAVMAILSNRNGSLRFFIFLWLAYCVVLWAWKGTTIGGMVMGIKVTRLDGRPLDFPMALIRGLAGILSVAAFGLGLIWAGIGPEKRAWHDKIAGTVMLKVPKGSLLA